MQIKRTSLLEKAIAPLMNRTGLRGAALMSSLFLTSDFKKSAGGNLSSACLSTLSSLQHFRKIHDLTTAINMIDERMDSSPPDWILNAGTPRLGTIPSPIFLSDSTCPREFTHAFNHVVKCGLTRRDVGIAFNNILAFHSYQRAEADHNFRDTPTLENREALHKANMQITEAYCVFIFRCLTKAKTIPNNLEAFSHKDATLHMPEVSHISSILQLFDDIRDILIDLEGEVLNGIPTSNWLALKMSQNRDYTTGSDKDKDVADYVRERQKCTESDKSPPDFIKRALNRTATEIDQMIKDIPSYPARSILSAMLDHLLQPDLKSSRHPEMQDKEQRRQAEKENLKLKYTSAPYCHIT